MDSVIGEVLADNQTRIVFTRMKRSTSKIVASPDQELVSRGDRVIRGGDRYMGYTEGMGIRRNRTRPVSGLNEGQKINKALWALAGKFANN